MLPLAGYKQLLDEVFVISRIIKVEVRVITVLLYIERTQKLGKSSLTASNTNRAKLT